jgi:hypothetical protein
LRTTIATSSIFPASITSAWLSLLDQMDLGDAYGALTLLSAFRDSFQASVQSGAPRPLGGLSMNLDQLFGFTIQVEQITAEMNRLGTMLED